VSVDQVGADVGTLVLMVAMISFLSVRRSGWCRRRHHEALAKSRYSRRVRRSGWCRRRHRWDKEEQEWVSKCPSIRLVPTSAPWVLLYMQCLHLVSVDQVGADVGTRRPSNPLLALRFRTAVRAFGKSHLATGTFMWLRLPSFQGISRGSSIPWTPRHHLRARGGC